MKKYIILGALTMLGLFQFIPSFEVFSQSSSSSITEQYTKKAEQTVKSYIARLEKSGFSNSDIISTLEKVRSLYVTKKSDASYTGARKISIDTIIATLDNTITLRKSQTTDDTDIYDIFNTVPKNTVTTQTVVNNTYTTNSTNNTTGNTTGSCSTEYRPVCGQIVPVCLQYGCKIGIPAPKTYGNTCELAKAGANYLYSGVCKADTDTPSVPTCTTGTFTNSSCICKDGTYPKNIDSGTRIQMYTCETVPVKLPPITACGKGIFYTGDCMCTDGRSPVAIAKNSLGQQAYSCDPTAINPPACTKEYSPVCATPKSNCTSTYCTDVMPQAKTYDNKCMMDAAGASYLYSGACGTVPSSVCTKEYAPVCGSMESATNCTPDGRCYVADGLIMTFNNKCELEKAKAKYLYSGSCKTTIDPPNPPICATGTLTNSNCICKDGSSPRPLASGTRIQAYTCEPVVVTPPTCTKEYAPVCAQMPRTSVDCAAGSITCTVPLPQTYDNKCMMNSAGASYLYSGACKTTIDPPSPPICATGNFVTSNCVCKDGKSPLLVEGGTKLQMYTCDPIITTQCTTEYAPVCGQYTPVCPIGMACLMAYAMPTTYTNKCELLKARATYLYSGMCTSDM